VRDTKLDEFMLHNIEHLSFDENVLYDVVSKKM
jgi:hypothetical protein